MKKEKASLTPGYYNMTGEGIRLSDHQGEGDRNIRESGKKLFN
jgi:hypothetical protein